MLHAEGSVPDFLFGRLIWKNDEKWHCYEIYDGGEMGGIKINNDEDELISSWRELINVVTRNKSY